MEGRGGEGGGEAARGRGGAPRRGVGAASTRRAGGASGKVKALELEGLGRRCRGLGASMRN